MKTSELTGAALDWAVAQCEGKIRGWQHHLLDVEDLDLVSGLGHSMVQRYKPSANWSQGGPIIEREGIEIQKGNPLYFPKGNERGDYYEPLWIAGKMHGSTPLIAAMRCYVASISGDEVEVPEELI